MAKSIPFKTLETLTFGFLKTHNDFFALSMLILAGIIAIFIFFKCFRLSFNIFNLIYKSFDKNKQTNAVLNTIIYKSKEVEGFIYPKGFIVAICSYLIYMILLLVNVFYNFHSDFITELFTNGIVLFVIYYFVIGFGNSPASGSSSKIILIITGRR